MDLNIFSGILSHEDDDTESETQSSKFTSSTSTEININDNLQERVKNAASEKGEKVTFQEEEAHVKRSIFKNLKDRNYTC